MDSIKDIQDIINSTKKQFKENHEKLKAELSDEDAKKMDAKIRDHIMLLSSENSSPLFNEVIKEIYSI